MSYPTIEYILPTSRSFAGMKRVLFQPFDIGKWFVLGFTAWLAGLLEGGGSGGTNSGSNARGNLPQEAYREAVGWVQAHLELVLAIGAALFLMSLALFILLLWLSSRGKFMFLDNVIHNRAEVKLPWRLFREQGNSLFLWKLVFGAIVFLILLLIVGGLVGLFVSTGGEAAVVAIVIGVVVLLTAALAIGYITVLLEDFVVPLMHRDSLTTNEAWGRFLVIHQASLGRFVLYFLWKFLLGIAAAFGIMAVGLGTCCIGFIVMAVPYIGAVLLLPVSVFFRLLGPEFLRQFGSDYDVMASATDATEGV